MIPLSIKGYKDVACHICNFKQPLENRPDVTAMEGGNGQMAPVQNGGAQNQGWQGGPPQQPHQPAPARYG